jgi:phosphatidate phosphatase APP1
MIVLFPTYARRLPGDRRWRATVAGMIARPLPPQSRRRTLAVGVIRRLLDLDEGQLKSEVFQRRADAFLFQRVAGERVWVEVGGRRIDAGVSDRTGHFHREFELDEATVEPLAGPPTPGCRWLEFEALLDAAADHGRVPPASARGRIQFVAEEGTSVISDIDDTVKVTNVVDRRELLANTLLREFHAVPGMADLFRSWQDAGSVFHYVSASPWQLVTCLNDFLHDAGLPAGSMHLKLFRLKDSTPLRRLPSRKRSKRRVIEQIMADFPRRRFLLVGDSGERDPEVYAAVARRNPDRVAGIAIRHLEGRPSDAKVRARLDRIGRELPRGGWRVFLEAAEIAELIPGG